MRQAPRASHARVLAQNEWSIGPLLSSLRTIAGSIRAAGQHEGADNYKWPVHEEVSLNSILTGDHSATHWADARAPTGEPRGISRASVAARSLVTRGQPAQARSFGEWLAGLAARLLDPSVQVFDQVVTNALSQFLEMAGVDRCLMISLSSGSLRAVRAWTVGPEAWQVPASVADEFPWLMATIDGGQLVAISRMEDLPAEAAIDRSSFEVRGVKACLILPLVATGQLKGALVFSHLSSEREWPDALVQCTRILADVVAGALVHRDTREELETALGFERKATDILRTLIEAPLARQDDVVEEGLADVARACRADRATLWQFVRAQGLFQKTHRWLADGVSAPPGGLQMPRAPWIAAQLERGLCVCFARHADLPLEAATDLRALRELGIGAAIFVPLRLSGCVAGALSVATVGVRPAWPRELVSRVQFVGEAFALVLARRESERRERSAQAHAAQAARIRSMGVFAASLVHELAQPLAASLSNAQTAVELLNAPVPDLDELRATVSDIVADSRRGGEMIHKLRRFLRQGEADRTEFDLGALLAEAVGSVKPEAMQRGVEIALRASQPLPEIVGDRAQIQQVLVNLLLNALDAVAGQDPCSRKVEVCAGASEAGVRIEVIDSGAGMDPSTQARIFQSFFTTKPQGLGLGLSISQTVIDNHGGVLSVQSEKGVGSTFRVELPARQAVIRFLPAALPAPAAEEAVFIIDDDDAVRRALARQLQTQGYRVEAYANAQAFFERAPRADVACIVSDMRMAGTTGLELQARLARSDVRWPIVFMSADADIPTTVHAIKAGAVSFLAKPFQRTELLAAVAEAIARNRVDHRDRCRDAAILARHASLTPREGHVFKLVSAGLLNKLIADRLGIAESTVKIHRARMMEKMGANSVADLVRMAQHVYIEGNGEGARQASKADAGA